MSESFEKKIHSLGHFTQISFFSFIFVIVANVGGIRACFKHILHQILFPIAIAPDAVNSFIALLKLFNTKNRNFGTVFNAFFVPARTALVFIAVFAGLAAFTVHTLFLIAVGSGLAYHLSLVLYNTFAWLRIVENTSVQRRLKSLYEENIKEHLLASLMGGIVLTAVLTLFVFASSLSALALCIIGGVLASSLFLLGAFSFYRSFFKQANTLSTRLPESAQENDKQPFEPTSSLIDHIQQDLPLNAQADRKVTSRWLSYFDRRFLAENLSSKPNDAKSATLNEIFRKKQSLSAQISASEKTIGELLWGQFKKRQKKLFFMDQLESNLKLFFEETNNVPESRQSIFCSLRANPRAAIEAFYLPGAYQSFFLCKSATEEIKDMVVKCMETYLEVQSTEKYQSSNLPF